MNKYKFIFNYSFWFYFLRQTVLLFKLANLNSNLLTNNS